MEQTQATTSWILYLTLCGAGLTMAFTWLGPSVSEGLDPLTQLIFWACHIFPSLVFLAAAQVILGRFRWTQSLPEAAQVLVAGGVAALAFTPVALAIDFIFVEAQNAGDGEGPFLLEAVREFGAFSVPMVLGWLLINAPSLVSVGKLGASGPVSQAPQPSNPPPPSAQTGSEPEELLAKVPNRLGREIIAMTAELHYLRVYTTEGDTLILFGFGRAVELMAHERGMQVHRSHWINLAYVDEIVSEGDKVSCRMLGGLDLPVSRKHRKTLREALKQR